MNKKQLKERSKLLRPVIRVGKNGITPELINEIKQIIIKKHLIKIKLLSPVIKDKNKKEIAAELIEKTGTTLIDQVGFVVVLYKE